MENSKRDSGIEMLRIFSMILILIHHFAVHSNFAFNEGTLTFEKIFIDILASVGKLGVNIFIVISCYFLIDSKPKIKKVLLFIIDVTFYSILMYIISALVLKEFSYKNLIESILPFIFDTYWFATTYIVFYIISPLINIIINNIERKIYSAYILILSFIFVVIPTFFYKAPEFSNLAWFIYMYLVIGFIKKYKLKVFNDYKMCKMLTISGICFIILSVIIFNIIGTRINVFWKHSAYFSSINKIPSTLTSIFMFYMIKNKQYKFNSKINNIAKSVFSVYLIHDNPFFSSILWETICHNSLFRGFDLIIHFVVVCSVVFIGCIVMDKIRIKLFEKSTSKMVDYLLKKWETWYSKIEKYL